MRASSSKSLYVGAALIVALSSVISAQGLSKEDQTDCDKAAKIIAKGHPEKKEASAMLTLGKCGAAGGNAIAAGLLTYAHDTDVATIDEYTYQMNAWRDGAVLDAATSLANDASATPAARVFAVRYLISLIHPYLVYAYPGLTAGDVVTHDADGGEITTFGCSAQIGSEMGDRVGTPLPADFAARAQATLEALANSPATPTPVRNAARCWK